MLKALGGVILAVRDTKSASETFGSLFGAAPIGTGRSDALGAELAFLACGTDVISVAAPAGSGPVADHLERWGEGLIAAVFTTPDVGAVADRLSSKGVGFVEDNDTIQLDPGRTFGLRLIIAPHVDREPVGAISFLYEVTHLVADWKTAADFLTDAFGLHADRFSPIRSEFYGYEGTLTLLDPPAMLDRIEVVTPYETEKAMGRFFVKHGDGPYMFYTETADVPALAKRLDAAGARYAGDPAVEGQSLFIHPSSTHGVLIGVSATNVAWRWSGRPELAGTQASTS
jgi:catechol 2,3-dioxygenase-like lactoylglutathione lyase family enzyme